MASTNTNEIIQLNAPLTFLSNSPPPTSQFGAGRFTPLLLASISWATLKVTTAHDAWQRLVADYASASRGRIISLKAKLTRNPRGSRSISAYLNDMRAVADDLALAQCPVSEEDLLVHILTQLGEEYNSIISAVRVREKPLSLGELADVLPDHELQLKDADDSRQLLATTNATQRTSSPRNNRQLNFNRNTHTNTNNYRANRSTWKQGDTNRPTVICKFCNFAGHETKVCRKLARFLKEHNVLTTQMPPTAQSALVSPPWMFDSGASHHATSSLESLQSISEYNGPDEVRLGDVCYPYSILCP
ncbi:PREDICTED: uncharacterized protein LOC109152126 [Ipomoea nil]|uniref:uncharacterized protein LOC109152126 n=1 Tax=Ipomoea nil TaxID=35883 RepID=UPI000900B11E|nr:PREDICTED: uncharacterized protein LOC109152126 [Ipomoea nil]